MSVITDVDVSALRLTFREPMRLGREWIGARDVAVVRFVDADGRVGLGEALELPHRDAVATARSWAIGQTPAALRAIGGPWALGVLPQRMCGAIDGALLDLSARQAGVTVAHHLAGDDALAEVRVNALLVVTAPDGSHAETATGLAVAGFETLKLKLEGGVDGAPDAWWGDAIGEVRAAVGGHVRLRVDLNGSLTPDAAVVWLSTLVGLDLEYVEQPIAPEQGPEALARLRAAGVPIAADESVTDLGAALDLLDVGCDALVVKPARVGGAVRAGEIIRAAHDAGVPVTVSTLYGSGVGLATALHLAATTPGEHAHGLTTGDLLADDPVDGTPAVTRGRMPVHGPGLGVTLR